MAVPKGTSVGIDLSNPVRVAAFSEEAGKVVATMTAKAPFDPGSKVSLTALAKEIAEFRKSLGARLSASACLPMTSCLLFTIPMPKLSHKEFNKALQLEVGRLAPGNSDNMRVVARQWPPQVPVPPSVKVPQSNTLYLVVAADVDAVLAAQSVMKTAGLRPAAVEIPASPACRASWWLWGRPAAVPARVVGAAPATQEEAQNQMPDATVPDPDKPARLDSTYAPWVIAGEGTPRSVNGTDVTDEVGAAASEPVQPDSLVGGQEDVVSAPVAGPMESEAGPGTILDISLVAGQHVALLHLSFGACPWLMREIPLDPGNPFVNAQILAGEVARSSRFARTAVKGPVTGRVTVYGESDRTSFLVDFLKEQAGLSALTWGQPLVECAPEYGVAVGLTLKTEGGVKK